ncbi:MAG: ABC-F family ATP-binding cassette domain-containing protein [Gammaproteobacteria bacterium]
MLHLKDITITRGVNSLIEHINLDIFEKQSIGLVGANGCGKSSLFAAIRGDIDLADGEIDGKSQLQISSLEQEVPGLSVSALRYVMSGDVTLDEVLSALEKAEATNDHDMLMSCHQRMYEIDGYSAEAKAAKILIGLGFTQEQVEKPIKDFSGGWRMRVSLGKCLFSPSDILLLDEPTNHLDLEAILWLEKYLSLYPGVILLISHDRDFLDHTVKQIAHIENKQLKLYTGDYSSFEQQRAQAIAMQNAQHRKQQVQLKHMQSYVDRFRYKASKAKQAQSRLRAIEKMEIVSPVHESSPFRFHFMKPDRLPTPLLTMDRVNLGYGDKTVLEKVNLSIGCTDRIGLLGVNGAGKSTLIKGMCGAINPLAGKIKNAPGLKIGYFAQHQVDALSMDESPLQLLRNQGWRKTEKEAISYLGSFNFSREQSLTPLQTFSGGEKSRVALALIIAQKPNLLLLDEPTNHLDLEVRQALVLALEQFEGGMILISHDRYLLRTLVDELYIVEQGFVNRFDGAVEDYQ